MRRHRTGISWAWFWEHMATEQFLHPGFRKLVHLAMEGTTVAAPHQRKAFGGHSMKVLGNLGASTRAGWRPEASSIEGIGHGGETGAVDIRQQCGDPRAERNGARRVSWESDSRAVLARLPSTLSDGGGMFQAPAAWRRVAESEEAQWETADIECTRHVFQTCLLTRRPVSQ